MTTYAVPPKIASHSHIDKDTYETLYKQSVEQPDIFWSEQARAFLSWQKPWDTVGVYDFYKGEASWFVGGKLNVAERG